MIPKKIYIDMDGVLVDFNGGVKELCGIEPQAQGIKHRSQSKDDEMWSKIHEIDHFYSKLKPLLDGFSILNFCLENFDTDKIEILTGVPKPSRQIAYASEDKKIWVKEHISNNIKVNTVLRADKKNFALGKEYVLIDDHPNNIKSWNEAGGTGILFKSKEQVISELNTIMEKDFDTVQSLIDRLSYEKKHHIKGGIYNKLQVDFAYNSNHIEGSKLSHDQTRYIFETHTVGMEPARIDDVIEAVNHFRCFDYILDTINNPLTEDYIKNLHKMLKSGTFDAAERSDAVIGDYKKYPNEVGSLQTSSPKNISKDINQLLKDYTDKILSFDDILDFHARYEKIHPFYDGNGRTGRLIMFKQCLQNDIVPFIIEDKYKGEYNRGLYEWQNGREKGYLRDTCLFMQDYMYQVLNYFEISHDDNLENDIEEDLDEEKDREFDADIDEDVDDFDIGD